MCLDVGRAECRLDQHFEIDRLVRFLAASICVIIMSIAYTSAATYSSLSQPAICCGAQSSFSLTATIRCNSRFLASRQSFGRCKDSGLDRQFDVFSARELGGETELWRAYRRYAGVLHFVYLTSSDTNGFTSDNFLDLQKLKLEPHFAEAMEQAFKPLGVYLKFWHTAIGVNDARTYDIYMVIKRCAWGLTRSRAG
jgi:hypothetical protein